MDLFMALQIAWKSILVNKMRSSLTMLGIIIGVSAVIAMVALSQGATAGITDRITSMGSNLLVISPGGSQGPVRGNAVGQLTLDDAKALGQIPMVKNVAPETDITVTVTAGSNTWTAPVDGTTNKLQDIKAWTTSQGGFFDDSDVQKGAMVAVLGKTVVDNLFPNGVNLGTSIHINGLQFSVIGVLAVRGSAGLGVDQDNTIYIPITTAQQRLVGSTNTRMTIDVQAIDQNALPTLQDAVTAMLRQRHRLIGTKGDDFRIQNMAQVLSTVEDTTKIMSFLLGGIAGVSLLVGGIGIMNIMLVSVTERTKEIGIRMALGATTSAILTQFIIEALLLSIMGGIIGIFLGWGATRLLAIIAGWRMEVVPWLALVAIGFSTMVGLFFGYYPAQKAANFNPIEALRYE